MEAESTSETSVNVYQTTQRYNTGDSHLQYVLLSLYLMFFLLFFSYLLYIYVFFLLSCSLFFVPDVCLLVAPRPRTRQRFAL
jgi:hypothetical protein